MYKKLNILIKKGEYIINYYLLILITKIYLFIYYKKINYILRYVFKLLLEWFGKSIYDKTYIGKKG